MDVKPISDEELEKWKDSELSGSIHLSRNTLFALFARIDAEKARADRVCRWRASGKNWQPACYPMYDDDYYAIDHPNFCPHCGGRVVTEDRHSGADTDGGSTPTHGSALALAKQFHDTYERLAPSFGYKTRPETRNFDPDSTNGRLMVAVCREIIEHNYRR
jgi:hypothetical protein